MATKYTKSTFPPIAQKGADVKGAYLQLDVPGRGRALLVGHEELGHELLEPVALVLKQQNTKGSGAAVFLTL